MHFRTFNRKANFELRQENRDREHIPICRSCCWEFVVPQNERENIGGFHLCEAKIKRENAD
jgi:hypothetical protein